MNSRDYIEDGTSLSDRTVIAKTTWAILKQHAMIEGYEQ